VLATFVIGLREGVEAALIVGIVAAFLVREGRRDALRSMWVGVGLAVLLCLGIGAALTFASAELAERPQEIFEGALALVAVTLVTSMVVWMRRNARSLKSGLEASAGSALARGTATGLIVMAFLAVLREGFETSVFLLAQINGAGSSGSAGAIGAGLGIVAALIIGYLIYRGGIRINLRRFFSVTGVFLVLIAAGLVVKAVGALDEGGVITAGDATAFDLSWFVHPGTAWAALVTGMFGIPAAPSIVQAAAWAVYVVPMLAVVLWPTRRRPTRRRPARPAAAADPATGRTQLPRSASA